MKTEKNKVGRPIEKENRVKIGLSIDGETKELLDMLSEKSGRTKSKVFEEALKVLKEREDITTQRLQLIEDLGDDAFLDIAEISKNRKFKEAAKEHKEEVRNVG